MSRALPTATGAAGLAEKSYVERRGADGAERGAKQSFPPSPFPRSGKQNQSAPCARSSAPEAKSLYILR